jgi:hypothetical protein
MARSWIKLGVHAVGKLAVSHQSYDTRSCVMWFYCVVYPNSTNISGCGKLSHFVRFEDFTAVTLRNTVFSDVTPCG